MFSNVGRVRLVAQIAAVAVMVACAAPVARAADADDSATRQLMVSADFNHDGVNDVAEVPAVEENYSGPAVVLVTLGGRNGKSPVKLLVGRSPQAMVAGDFNHDGNLDLMVGDDDGSLRVFLGDGKGGFKPAAEMAHVGSIASITVGDYNHDGVLDVAVTDWRSTNVTVLMGVGDGSFSKGWSFPLRMAGTMPYLVTADFNHDHIPDIAVVYPNEDGDTFDVMLGNNTGMFEYSTALSTKLDPSAACAPEQMVRDSH